MMPPAHHSLQSPDVSGTPSDFTPSWPRRAWLTHNAALLGLTTLATPARRGRYGTTGTSSSVRGRKGSANAQVAAQAQRADPAGMEALAQRAVEAAHTAGAAYADAHLTRTVQHHYVFTGRPTALNQDLEVLGLGVRVLVDGCWGFSASPLWTADEAVRLAQDAVEQARTNARGETHTVDLGPAPVVTGRWATPVRIDPFSVTIEEKADTLAYWMDCAARLQLSINTLESYLHFARQERTVATSAGTCISQTCYESDGVIIVVAQLPGSPEIQLQGTDVCGKGWELFVDAQIPEQITRAAATFAERKHIRAKQAVIGKYTLVCDGVTMARIVEQTFGLATQLDRALGYEANASGTSYLDDPLGMLGHLQVAAPMVTLTANRSAPAQLATVKWDAEGVVPEEATLIKDGVLVDYQTTREQAAWLTPYYQKTGKPVRSHGYTASEDALAIPMQHMPNLALASGAARVELDDLVRNVSDGVLVTDVGRFDLQVDHQARNGTLSGTMWQIKNGRKGALLANGSILFNTQDFWKRVMTLGGPTTLAMASSTALNAFLNLEATWAGLRIGKGQPAQATGHSVRAPAALIADQALIDRRRKA